MTAAPLAVNQTEIAGLLELTLPVHADNRGWFKENWQRAKMVDLGLPDFAPVQQNVSFNRNAGTTRGFHAEPWDKLISVTSGSVFGAWVDLRAGDGFGRLVTRTITPEKAIFVPRGVANAFQTLEPATAYSYLVNDHWRPDLTYAMVNLADADLAVDWPIGLDRAVVSDKDRTHPALREITPIAPPPVAVIGSGQIAKALLATFPDTRQLTRAELDLTDPGAVADFDFSPFDVVVNAAAWTDVDGAETDEGRINAWLINATSVAALVRAVSRSGGTLVHFSSDYVLDGSAESAGEAAPYAPRSVYGQAKAAGDLAVSCAPRHYLIRTSWVIGEGKNFVATMRDLAERGISPKVVDDQDGRLSHTGNIAAAVAHLLATDAPYGTYNVTDPGPVRSWAQIAADTFAAAGRDAADVQPVSTAEYFGERVYAPRPRHSKLSLDKIVATGFRPAAPDNEERR